MSSTSLQDALPIIVVVLAGIITLFVLFGKPAPKKFFTEETKKEKKDLVLQERTQLTHDSVLLRFALPTPKTVLGLPVGMCFKIFCPNKTGTVKGEWNGRPDPEDDEDEIERKYTPTTSDDEVGYVDLVIKVYAPGVPMPFVDGGKASTYLDSLKVGDTMKVAGPLGMIEYKGKGLFTNGRKQLAKKAVGMIAGGSGITPMLQVIAAVLKDPNDSTTLSLIFGNKTEDDILVRDMLDGYQKAHPDRFKLWYTLDNPPANWKYGKGFVTEQMIKDHLPAAGPGTVTLNCGPPGMVKGNKMNLEKLGHEKGDVLFF